MEIVTASYLLPFTHGCPVIKDGAIACELGRILDVGPKDDLTKRYPQAEIKSFPGDLLMPGLVDAHCHLDMVDFYERNFLESGFAEPLEYIDTLVASIDYKQETPPEQIIAGMQKGISRLIETGVTCVGDITHYEGTFRLLSEMGLRAIVFPEILAGRGEAAQSRFEIALALVEKYADASDDRIRVGLAPYAPYLLSRNLLKIISQHARDTIIPIQIHAAESFAEMEFLFDSEGPIATTLFPALGWSELPPAQRKTPVQFLTEIGFLEAPVTIVGGLHLCASDFPILARHLTRVVYCPTMNRIMRHGNLPLGKLVESGIPVGLGTDIWNTRLGFSLWDEMREALTRGSTPLPTPRELLHMATIGGARALGLDHLIGTLEKGKQSDYILVRAPQFTDVDDCCAKLVTTVEPQHIHHVVVGEEILKSS